MRFQPAWGKHEMPTLDKMEYWNGRDWENNYKGMYEENMIVFVIKDPLTWMKSMCKANYDFRYFQTSFIQSTFNSELIPMASISQ